jgi:hypothetical protein
MGSVQSHKRQVDTAQESLFATLVVCCSEIHTDAMQAAINKRYAHVMYNLLRNHAPLPEMYLELYDSCLMQPTAIGTLAAGTYLGRLDQLIKVRPRCSWAPKTRSWRQRPALGCSLHC